MDKDRVMPKALQIEKLKDILAAYNRGVDVEHIIDWEAEVDETLTFDEQITAMSEKYSWYRWYPEPAYRPEEEQRRLVGRPETVSEEDYKRYVESIEGAPTGVLISDYESPVLLRWQQELYESEFKKRNIPQYEGEYLEPLEFFERKLVAPEYHLYRSKKYGYVQAIPGKKTEVITPDRIRRIITPAVPRVRVREIREIRKVEIETMPVIDEVELGREVARLARERYKKEAWQLTNEESRELYNEAVDIVTGAGKFRERAPGLESILMNARSVTGEFIFPRDPVYWERGPKEWYNTVPVLLYKHIEQDKTLYYNELERQGIPRSWIEEQLKAGKAAVEKHGLRRI